ncbi:MAG: ABC transporter ATP-binding protein [Synergistetes bacterium]|nr:ABC transporter ATP-binding protein [Synergistota bacterium]MCX8128114.1 ABC transporter ATP-binding protein [Synergistota bacterium]MDW8192490.1 ABC transporter ATP-binding protein [Synergistota bacterium]
MLQVKDLYAGYNNKAIIKNINFSLKEGDILVLLGPNGSGKSTVIKTMSGILKPFKGNIMFNDTDLISLKPRDRAKIIATLPQSLSFDFPFSVEEVVAMGRYPHHGKGKEIVEWAIERLDLQNLRKRKITSLSGGEFKRVVIAKTLAQSSKILLLDEPMNNLDLKHQFLLYDILVELSNNGSIIICALHDINITFALASSVMLLKDGVPLAFGLPKSVLTPELLEEVFQIKFSICDRCGSFLSSHQPQDCHYTNANNY